MSDEHGVPVHAPTLGPDVEHKPCPLNSDDAMWSEAKSWRSGAGGRPGSRGGGSGGGGIADLRATARAAKARKQAEADAKAKAQQAGPPHRPSFTCCAFAAVS